MSLLNKIRKTNVLFSIISVALGVLLIIFPNLVLNVFCYVIGGVSFIYGVVNIVNFFLGKNNNKSYSTDLIKGIILSVIGAIILIQPNYIKVLFPICFGIFLVVEGISYIQKALFLRGSNVDNWVVEMVFAVIALVIGLFVLINPFKTAEAIAILLGIAFACYGISSMWTYLFVQRKIDEIIYASQKNEIIDIDPIDIDEEK